MELPSGSRAEILSIQRVSFDLQGSKKFTGDVSALAAIVDDPTSVNVSYKRPTRTLFTAKPYSIHFSLPRLSSYSSVNRINSFME